jgi:hypothetical protein
LAGLSAPFALAEEKIDFATQIQPLLVQHCGKCHGVDKAQGKMRLHTAEAIQEKLAAEAKLLVPGKPEESELYLRISLPADDPKRMPKGVDPLPKDTIDLIGNWIKQGAALPVVAVAAEPAATPEGEPAEAAAAETPEAPSLPEVAAAPQEAIDKLTAAGAQVMPLFAGSSLLQVSFAHRDEPAGDADVAMLSGAADQIYALDLSGSKTSDAGLAALAALKNLSTLHLEMSAITDEGMAHLAGLGSLQYLNVYGTGVTDAGLKHVAGLKNLRRLYLWQTKVSYDAAMALEKETAGLEVNLGYNHPVVAKMRLTKEMEVTKKQVEEAQAETKKIEQQLESAKKNQEAVTARVAEIEKELKALETDATGNAVAASAPAAEGDAKPTEEAKPAEEAKPEEEAKPAEAETKPAEEAAPEEEKPAEEAKAAEEAKPAEAEAKPAEEAAPTEEAKPAEAEPAETKTDEANTAEADAEE